MLFLKNYRIIRHNFQRNKNALKIFKRLCSTSEINDKFLNPHMQKKIEEKWKNLVINYINKKSDDNIREHEKKYILSMFPYPSGKLHLGHVRVYTMGDANARFYHMSGWKVIHPMGWDAFGLPAENAAIERGVSPYEWTMSNIKSMKDQLNNLGLAFDWSREIATCDPDYYKWTQFLFLKLFQEKFAYKKESEVNWDPVDETVLANEQVDKHGCSWRSGAKVEKKILTQWFIKSTKFSKELFEDLSDPSLKNWEDISSIQRSWIGECNGYIIEMKLIDRNNKKIDSSNYLPVWMSEPEYSENIGFLSVKSDHLINKGNYANSLNKDYKVLDIMAVDPISNRQIPIIVSDKLIYKETDIYIGLPGIKVEDHNICKKLDLEIPPPVIVNESEKFLLRNKIITKLKEIDCGGYKNSPNLDDWLISRQRYWGTPIPIIYCKDCGSVPVPEEELPVTLPPINHKIKKGVSVLKEIQEWFRCPCPKCGKLGERETDTMDTFVDSSWYFLRYLDSKNENELVSLEKARNLMPVDLYVGGKEHALLHLYYARFIHKFLSHIGLVTCKEPFKQLLLQQFVKSKSYQVKSTGKYLTKEEVDFSVTPPVEKNTGLPLVIQFEKMSKSKYNGVDPQALVDEYGIDALRLAILADGSPRRERLWKIEDMKISYLIMSKIWLTAHIFVETRNDQKLEECLNSFSEEEFEKHNNVLFEARNRTILKVTEAFEETKMLQSAIKGVQELVRDMRNVPKEFIMSEEYEKCLRNVVLLLSPLCPHLCCELWQKINSVSVLESYKEIQNMFNASWPSVDPSYDRELKFRVNGKTICLVKIPLADYSNLTQETAIEMAYRNELMSSLLKDSPILNVEFLYKPQHKSHLNFVTKTKKEMKEEKKMADKSGASS